MNCSTLVKDIEPLPLSPHVSPLTSLCKKYRVGFGHIEIGNRQKYLEEALARNWI